MKRVNICRCGGKKHLRNAWCIEFARRDRARISAVREIRQAVEFAERLLIFKSNGHKTLTSDGYIEMCSALRRRPRENFVDYCMRVRGQYAPDHKIRRLRLKKGVRV
jgi:hypothetical protein